MACLKKVTSDLVFNCENLMTVGGLRKIEEAIILNSEDISTIGVTDGLATVTMKTGKKGYVVNSINNSVIYQDAIKTNDLTPSFEDHTVVIKVLTNHSEGYTYRVLIQQLLQGNFRVAMKTADGRCYLAGTYSGLEASDLATDSSTDGISTVTLKTPDAATGDVLYGILTSSYEGFKTIKA